MPTLEFELSDIDLTIDDLVFELSVKLNKRFALREMERYKAQVKKDPQCYAEHHQRILHFLKELEMPQNLQSSDLIGRKRSLDDILKIEHLQKVSEQYTLAEIYEALPDKC